MPGKRRAQTLLTAQCSAQAAQVATGGAGSVAQGLALSDKAQGKVDGDGQPAAHIQSSKASLTSEAKSSRAASHAAANAAVRAGGFGYLHGVEFCVFLGSFWGQVLMYQALVAII